MKSPIVIRRVVGDSMLPAHKHGDVVIGLGWYRNVRPGDVFIVHHNGKEKIKRVKHLDEDGKVWVEGDNKIMSNDSRHFGPLDRSLLLARVVEVHKQAFNRR